MERVFFGALTVAVFLSEEGAFAQAPTNDLFSNRAALVGDLPILAPGTCTDATAELGEPNHATSFDGNVASNSVWWSWTSTVSGTVSFTVSNADFDHVISVYTGTALNNLVEVGFADQIETGSERVAIPAVGGTTYVIAVDGYSNSGAVQGSGPFELELEFVPAPDNDDFDDAVILDPALPTGTGGTTFGGTPELGEPDHGNAIFGNLVSNSVWHRWTAPASGPVIASCFGDNLDSVLAVYTGGAVSSLTPIGAADSLGLGGIEKVAFTAVAGTTYSIAVDAWSDTGRPVAGWAYVVTVSQAPDNDGFAQRQDLGSSAQIDDVPGSVIGAGAEVGEPNHANSAAGNVASSSVWYRWTAPRTALMAAEVSAVYMDSVVAIYTGSELGALTEVASQDLLLNGGTERAVFNAIEGVEYSIAVDGFAPANANGVTATEDLFRLSVFEVPPNDDLADRIDLSGRPLPISVQGTTLNASSELFRGEPDHAFDRFGNRASNSVWYDWTASSAETIEVALRDLSFDGVLAVYALGAGGSGLTEVATADSLEPDAEETLTFVPVSGQQYVIAVDVFSIDGSDGGGGPFTLNISMGGESDPYMTWIGGYPSLVGADAEPGATPMSDGVTNLEKLVLGLDPTIPIGSDPNRGNFPRLRTFNGNPALEYTVAPDNLGDEPNAIQHVGEISTGDLSSWTEVGAINIGGSTWVIEIPTAGAESRFGRLKVVDPSG